MFRSSTLLRFSASPRSATATRSFSASARSNLARMTVVGRLGADPERVNTSTGKEIVRYVVGSNYGPPDNQKTSWFRVTSFDDSESRIEYTTSIPKGSLVYVEAEATLPTYTVEGQAGPDGTPLKRSSLNLVQRYLQVLKRPYAEQGSTTGAESEADSAAEEPLSGVGQS